MFDNVLSKCKDNYDLCKNNYEQTKKYCRYGDGLALILCSSKGCQECLNIDFNEGPDNYDCYKKMNYYVLKYGSAFISEIYHYLNISKILEPYKGQRINVLSLGCGFCPDYYALWQYITDNELGISLSYCGIDKSEYWDSTRLNISDIKYQKSDLTDPFSFENCQIIMMNKVFSTIYKHKLHIVFLQNLEAAINTMDKNSVLIFNDVNSVYMGRDVFSRCIDPLFEGRIRKFYTDNPEYKGDGTWEHIQDDSIICPITNISGIDVLQKVRQSVFFEYRK